MHINLFCGEAGERIIGIATLCALIEIITGYILWGKRTISLAHSLSKRDRKPLGSLRKNISFTFPDALTGLHNAGGFWSGIPLLIMILTSLTWCFGWYSEIVYFLFESKNSGSWDNNLFHTLHGLHVGSWEGLFSRLLWFVAVGLGASLPVTGIMLFLRRISRNGKHRKLS
ncbi:MAG: PepSY domain-containing protein [Muribaculaceae bacterium]|nr:PepSY domain-containing protein [Muribaculaceae bacterium]